MSKVAFPLVEINKNRFIDINGNISFVNKLEPCDLSQKTGSEIDSIYSNIELTLNNMNEGSYLRFYRFNDENYIQSEEELTSMFGIKNSPDHNLLDSFFFGNDLYSDIGIYDDYIAFNGKYRRILSAKDIGLSEISQSPIPSEINYVLDIKKNSNLDSLRDLERVRKSHQENLNKKKREIESEGAYNQAEELIEDLTYNQESIFDFELYILVDGNSLEEVNEKTIEIIQSCKLQGIELFIEGHSLKKLKTGVGIIFSNLIPGVKPKFKYRSLPNKTSHLSRLIPIDKSFLMDDGLLFFDNRNRQVHFNPLSSIFKNRNILVSGASGGGKSVLVNYLAHHLIEKSVPAVIIDKGGSYKKLCLYHGGIELTSGVNPMHFRNADFLLVFILSFTDTEKFKKLERGKLLKRIKNFLDKNTSIHFFDLLQYIEEEFSGISFYFESAKDFIHDEPLKIEDLLYIDFETYPKNLIAPVILYVIEYFNQLGKKDRLMVFDEAWEFLKAHGEYLDESFRTIRKTGGILVAISQGLMDFKEVGELYNSIVNNSFFKLYFPQEYIDDPSTSRFDNQKVGELLYEKGLFSEFYLKTQDNNHKKSLRLYLSALEKELFHTEAGKSNQLFKFIDDHKDYYSTTRESIDNYVRLHHEVF